MDVDVIDGRFSQWVENYNANHVHELIREFIVAADYSGKTELIIPFIKTMLKKKVFQQNKEQHVLEIIKNLDSLPMIQQEALIKWKYEVLKALQNVPELGINTPESFDVPISEISK